MIARSLALVLGLIAVPAIAQESTPPVFVGPFVPGPRAEKVPPRFGTVTEITPDGRLTLQVVEFRTYQDFVMAQVDADGLTGETFVAVEKTMPVARELSFKLDKVRVENFRGNEYDADEVRRLFVRARSVVYSRSDETVDSAFLGLMNEDALHLILPPDRGKIAGSPFGVPVMAGQTFGAIEAPELQDVPPPPEVDDRP